MDEPPGAAVKARRGCAASIYRVCGIPLGILHEWEEEPIRREGGKIASPFLSFRPTVSFPAVASRRPNARTTRTTPSGGRRWRPTSVHLDFHLLPLWFSCQNTHSAPLHSSLLSSLYLQTRNGEIGQRERARSLSGRSTASLAVSRSEEEKRGRKRAERAEEKKTLEIQ